MTSEKPFITFTEDSEPPFRKIYRTECCSSYGFKGTCFLLTLKAKKQGKSTTIKCDVNARCEYLNFYDYGTGNL
ncbi:MAG: hypothetical protein IJ759_00160 [Bacteroidales bacterium]|nr:hypothetical protein [Bacteroidales bacterium]